MKYIITSHAKARMKERGIMEENVKKTIEFPTETLYDENKRFLFKRLYRRNGKERLLLVAGEWRGKTCRIITVIETSKIKKYI